MAVFDAAVYDPAVFETGAAYVVTEAFLRVFIGGQEISANDTSWNISTEEVLGGGGSASLLIWDKSLYGLDFEPHREVVIMNRATGWLLFHGETMTVTCDINPVQPYPVWTIQCRDYFSVLSERVVGAPDGFQFWRPNDQTPYIPIDASAQLGGDLSTITYMLEHYVRFAGGAAFSVDTYVGEYVNPDILLYQAMTTVQGAFEVMAASSDTDNIQFWADPDDAFHWVAIPTAYDLLAGATPDPLLGTAPAVLGDRSDGADNALMSLRFTKDGGPMVEQFYIQGATTYVQDPDDGLTVSGGSGFYPGVSNTNTSRQAYLSVPHAINESIKNTVGAAAVIRASQPSIRGTGTVQGVDEWRVGQLVTIKDSRLPVSLSSSAGEGQFVIQRVHMSANELAGSTHLYYTLDFGDGPTSRQFSGGGPDELGQGALTETGEGVQAKAPITTWAVDWEDFGPIGKNQERDFTVTPVNGKGEPWGPPGMPVTFSVVAEDSDGNRVADEGTTDPEDTTTDLDGKARGTLHTSETRDDLSYQVVVKSPLAPAV